MSELKELVPPLDLCKLIPAGEFAESAFVWVVNGDYQPKFQIVDKRKYPFIPEDGATLYPAPTLEEVLRCLPDWSYLSVDFVNPQISLRIKKKEIKLSPSPAAEVLKIWLKQKGIEDEQKQS